MNKRIEYFDMLRGVAIIMVVLIHNYGYVYSFESVSLITITFRNILNVAVPIFLVISGYFLAEKTYTKNNYYEFLNKQVQRVYIPVLFCSLPLFFKDINQNISIIPIIKLLTCSYSVYYFVAVIIQCYILLPFLQRINYKCSLALSSIVAIVWMGVYTYCFLLYYELSLPLIVYAGNFLMWGFYFILGMSFRNRRFQNISLLKLLIMLSIFLFASVFESFYIMDKTRSLSGGGQKITAFFLNSTLIFILFNTRTIDKIQLKVHSKIFRIISLLGEYSFGVYLIHLSIISILNSALNIKSIDISPLFIWSIFSIVIISLSFIILWLCRKSNAKLSRLLLGV